MTPEFSGPTPKWTPEALITKKKKKKIHNDNKTFSLELNSKKKS